MSVSALSGNDTTTLNNRILSDLGDGDAVTLEYPNDIASVKTGKNGNSIYGFNASGKQADVKLRVIRGSSDDKFLNNLLAQQQANFAGFALLSGTFVKKVGDGAGNVLLDTYIMSGGIFVKQVHVKDNVEGDAAQSISEYHIKFSNSPRVMG